jgi:hypothetical protein
MAELRGRLLKFHGCAIRAAADPTNYRQLLIGRQSQITSWPEDPVVAVMRQQLVSLATLSPTLMIGLSAQDLNIQQVFIKGQATMGWVWPSHPPAYIFAEEQLGPDQSTLLQCVYREHYSDHREDIESAAQIRAFAKPLLLALLLHFLWQKLHVFARHALAPQFQAADHSEVENGLRYIRDQVAQSAEPDRLAFVKLLVESSRRGLGMFRHGKDTVSGDYSPLSIQPIDQIGGDPNLHISGLPEAAISLGVLGAGWATGKWRLEREDHTLPRAGAMRITPIPINVPQRLFFVVNSESALQLHLNGLMVPDEPDAILLYSTPPVTRQPRSPRSAPGRTGALQTREVDLRSIIKEARSFDELQQRFCEEAVL